MNHITANITMNPIMNSLLISWQTLREAIGQVETSQPVQISAAMVELLRAREEMSAVIYELMKKPINEYRTSPESRDSQCAIQDRDRERRTSVW